MKNKELIKKLSRLQSKAYSLQNDIQRVIREVSEKGEGK